MRVAVGYVRVSSRSQDDALQRAGIARVADARGDQLSCIYADQASGRTLERPELARLRERARRGELRRVYVWRIDRLTRSGIRDTLALVQELREHGAELISVADGFSLDGPAGDVVLAVMAWAAEMERTAIGDRIRAARERVEASGGRWGRARRLTPSEVAQALLMRERGRTWRSIAMALRCPKTTLLRSVSAVGDGNVDVGRKVDTPPRST